MRINIILVVIVLSIAISLSADSEVNDCFTIIHERLDFRESGKCGYKGHWYNTSWLIGEAFNEIYGDSVKPKYDWDEFKGRIAGYLNETGMKGGYLDTLESDYKIDAGDITLNAVYHFDCCPDIVLTGYYMRHMRGIEVAYSEESDRFYILSDIFDDSVIKSYNRMIEDLEQFSKSDPMCRATMLLALLYDGNTTTIMTTEKDLIAALYFWYPDPHEQFLSTRELYRFAPYNQANSMTRSFYDSLIVNNGLIRDSYNSITDKLTENDFSIIPPELRTGAQMDTVVVTIYNTACPHFALWNVVFTEEGFLDTLMLRDYLHLGGNECRLIWKWIDTDMKKWLEGD